MTNHKSFYALYDERVLKQKTCNPQVAFILGLYFYKIKRLDSASKCFIKALTTPYLRISSLMHLLDIALHDTGYNLYSNHFHKEKYASISSQNSTNVGFIVSKLADSDIPELLKKTLSEIKNFINILNSSEGSGLEILIIRKQKFDFVDV